jgi:hypothetical protein
MVGDAAAARFDGMVQACVAAFGVDLVAYLAGAKRPLGAFRLGSALVERIARQRLQTAYGILQDIPDPPRARAWLRNVNLDLGRRSPADLIRSASTESDLARVRLAANGAGHDA